MKKRVPYYLLLTTYFSLWLAKLVSAQSGPIDGLERLAYGANEAIRIIIQFIYDFIFNLESYDEFLFAKILIFTLILIITYTVIKENKMFGGRKNKAIQWIISSAISILAIRYLPDNFVQAILLQYGALAVGLTVFLPLAIYFFFLHQSGIGPFGRRLGWIVFIASFFALWSFRGEDLGAASWIYIIAIGFIIISMIFDKSIHKYLGLGKIRKITNRQRVRTRVEAQAQLKELRERREHYSDKEFEEEENRLEEIIKENLPK